ncbi:MAG: pyridoxamine 5'-phosphate oxidase family protein [Victivallaceae bacterium]|nr:pyridoxamine 5'-phosphate oxidase family protein [Victivallaceae bacterium]
MKAKWILPLIAVALCCTGAELTETEKAENQEKVCRFLKDAGHYYIATVENDQPRVRPFGTIHIFDGKLYIQTGKKKNVSRQLAANGKVELCALKDGKWIRVSGTLVNDDRREAKASMLEAYPSLKKLYSPDDDNTQVLYFQNGSATIYSFDGEPVTLKF